MKKFNMIMFLLAFLLAFFIYTGGKGVTVHAAERPQVRTSSIASRDTHILHTEGSDASGSGVTELDGSLTRGKKFLVGIIHFFGAAVALFGVVFAAIGFLGRDNEQKIIGITAFIVGVAIFFAPQIVNAVVGQTIF